MSFRSRVRACRHLASFRNAAACVVVKRWVSRDPVPSVAPRFGARACVKFDHLGMIQDEWLVYSPSTHIACIAWLWKPRRPLLSRARVASVAPIGRVCMVCQCRVPCFLAPHAETCWLRSTRCPRPSPPQSNLSWAIALPGWRERVFRRAGLCGPRGRRRHPASPTRLP